MKRAPQPLVPMTLDWQPSTSVRNDLILNYPGSDIDAVIQNFRMYWKTAGNKKTATGWDRTLVNRVTKLSEMGFLPDIESKGNHGRNGRAVGYDTGKLGF